MFVHSQTELKSTRKQQKQKWTAKKVLKGWYQLQKDLNSKMILNALYLKMTHL